MDNRRARPFSFADGSDSTLTETPGARVSDERPGKIDWRRPASPWEAESAVRRRQPPGAPAAPSFEVGRVVRRSASIVRGRWFELLVLTYVVGWGPLRIIAYTRPDGYRAGSHDLAAFGLTAAVSIGAGLIQNVALAMIMAASLRGHADSPGSSISKVLRALPALFPVWIALQLNTVWGLWASWINLAQALRSGARLVRFIAAESMLELTLAVVATAAVGVLIPVVIEERRGLLWSTSRAFRLMQGARWKVIALLMLYILAVALLSIPAAVLRLSHAGTAAAWVTSLLSAAMGALWCVVVAASYLELRETKEGAPHDQTAETFA